MKTTNRSAGHLTELVHSSQATMHNFSDRVRVTAEKPRRFLDSRRRNEILRDLGQLHYDAHQTGNAPHPKSVNRLIAQLDHESHGATNTAPDGQTQPNVSPNSHSHTQPHGPTEPDETGKGDE